MRCLYHAKRNHRRRLENNNVDQKYAVMRKIENVVAISGNRGLQKTELQNSQLGIVM